MAERKEVTFNWSIENFIYPFSNLVQSPSFAVGQTDWNLRLHTSVSGRLFGVSLKRAKNGPENIVIGFKVSLIDSENSPREIFSNDKCNLLRDGLFYFEDDSLVEELETLESKFLKKDTLIVRCCLWLCNQALDESMRLKASTRIGEERRMNFQWKICNFSTLGSTVSKKIPLFLSSNNGEQTMKLELIHQENLLGIKLENADGIEWLSLLINVFVLDAFGKKKLLAEDDCQIENLKSDEEYLSLKVTTSELIANRERYLPNGVLTLIVECSFSQIVVNRITHIDYGLPNGDSSPSYAADILYGTSAHSVTPHSAGSNSETCDQELLVNAMKELYENATFCDFKIEVGSKCFSVHRNILSARCPAFSNMFTSGMREELTQSTCITDVEADTMSRFLLYLYTGTLNENLDWECVMKLYSAARKYLFTCLETKCSAMMEKSLSVDNACQLLSLADMHSNHTLKTHAQNFIRVEFRKISASEEWKYLKNANPKLANETIESKLLENINEN